MSVLWEWFAAAVRAVVAAHTLIIAFIAAMGTIAVAALALWGDWIRARWFGPILELRLRSPVGDLNAFEDRRRVLFHHLDVINRRDWAPARNCRVMLVGIHRRDGAGTFRPLPLALPLQFQWSHPQMTPITPTITTDRQVDFLTLIPADLRAIPVLYLTPNNFDGIVLEGTALRYWLEIAADNYVPRQRWCYEVEWDGEWVNDAQRMAQHLQVREITGEVAAQDG